MSSIHQLVLMFDVLEVLRFLILYVLSLSVCLPPALRIITIPPICIVSPSGLPVVSVCAKLTKVVHTAMHRVKILFIIFIFSILFFCHPERNRRGYFNFKASPPINTRSASSLALILVFFSKVRVTFLKKPRSLPFLPVDSFKSSPELLPVYDVEVGLVVTTSSFTFDF